MSLDIPDHRDDEVKLLKHLNAFPTWRGEDQFLSLLVAVIGCDWL